MRKEDIEKEMERRIIIKNKNTGEFVDTCILFSFTVHRTGNRDYLRISVRHHNGGVHHYDIEAKKIIDVVDNYLKPRLKNNKRN